MIKIVFKTNFYMRKHLLSLFALVLGTTAGHAQTVSDFETLSLSNADTFYVNYSSPGHDVGFTNGLAYFSCVYDTVYGGIWEDGFAYSDRTDSVTSGYTNQYSAKPAKGYNGSNKYAVASTGGGTIKIHLSGTGIGNTVPGFYITNSTYAYNAMRDGYFNAKKFGGTTGNDPDWFKLTVKAYLAGVESSDSVDFYLADFRSANKYIVKDWQWVNLLPLGNADSLSFTLSSSDTAGGFGMNTPAYFCIDNFTVNDASASVSNVTTASVAKVYPNPAKETLNIELNDNAVRQLSITDISGRTVYTENVSSEKMRLNVAALPAGIYLLHLKSDDKTATVRLVKQ
jgi:hypothetical protein